MPNPVGWSDPLGLAATFCSASQRWRNPVTGRYVTRPSHPGELLNANGQIGFQDIQRWVASSPGGTPPNIWAASPSCPTGGFRYDFVENGARYRFWGHGANGNAPAGSHAASGPTVRVHVTDPNGQATGVPLGHLTTFIFRWRVLLTDVKRREN